VDLLSREKQMNNKDTTIELPEMRQGLCNTFIYENTYKSDDGERDIFYSTCAECGKMYKELELLRQCKE